MALRHLPRCRDLLGVDREAVEEHRGNGNFSRTRNALVEPTFSLSLFRKR